MQCYLNTSLARDAHIPRDGALGWAHPCGPAGLASWLGSSGQKDELGDTKRLCTRLQFELLLLRRLSGLQSLVGLGVLVGKMVPERSDDTKADEDGSAGAGLLSKPLHPHPASCLMFRCETSSRSASSALCSTSSSLFKAVEFMHKNHLFHFLLHHQRCD